MSASAIQSQVAAIAAAMSDRPAGLVRHTKRVVAESIALARCWEVDPERIELAAWGHDLYRAHKPGDLLALAWEWKIPVSQAEEDNAMLLHGPIAAYAMATRFGVSDEDVLQAVREHTLGAPGMSLIAKIVLLADKVEPNKRDRTPLMKPIRRAARRDIDLAMLAWADWRWVENRTRELTSPPMFWSARQSWVPEHHLELLRTAPQRTDDNGWYEAVSDAFEPEPDRRSLEERRAARRMRDENRAQTVR
jgi:predicted HD superfamily hydrolase involved in NAD metabolism